MLHIVEIENLALAAVDQRPDVVLPHDQRGAHLTHVGTAVVDARRTRLVAAVMVQDLLNDVGRDSDVRHAGRDTAAQIMHGPVFDAAALIERRFGLAPGGKGRRTIRTTDSRPRKAALRGGLAHRQSLDGRGNRIHDAIPGPNEAMREVHGTSTRKRGGGIGPRLLPGIWSSEGALTRGLRGHPCCGGVSMRHTDIVYAY